MPGPEGGIAALCRSPTSLLHAYAYGPKRPVCSRNCMMSSKVLPDLT